jgi:hypothetical protein
MKLADARRASASFITNAEIYRLSTQGGETMLQWAKLVPIGRISIHNDNTISM